MIVEPFVELVKCTVLGGGEELQDDHSTVPQCHLEGEDHAA
jgi:hypothetical protein